MASDVWEVLQMETWQLLRVNKIPSNTNYGTNKINELNGEPNARDEWSGGAHLPVPGSLQVILVPACLLVAYVEILTTPFGLLSIRGIAPEKKKNNPESGYKTRKKKRTLCTGTKKYDSICVVRPSSFFVARKAHTITTN
eukprot:scaffold200059_cov42-Attheya_sp.AAC.1